MNTKFEDTYARGLLKYCRAEGIVCQTMCRKSSSERCITTQWARIHRLSRSTHVMMYALFFFVPDESKDFIAFHDIQTRYSHAVIVG